jgi:hypothetical protein
VLFHFLVALSQFSEAETGHTFRRRCASWHAAVAAVHLLLRNDLVANARPTAAQPSRKQLQPLLATATAAATALLLPLPLPMPLLCLLLLRREGAAEAVVEQAVEGRLGGVHRRDGREHLPERHSPERTERALTLTCVHLGRLTGGATTLTMIIVRRCLQENASLF